jgi:hypothetical protein
MTLPPIVVAIAEPRPIAGGNPALRSANTGGCGGSPVGGIMNMCVYAGLAEGRLTRAEVILSRSPPTT